MAEETITILKVGTEEAVKSVNDLKDNIKLLKGNLGELEIGTQEYQNTLEELKVNQNALKDAMYATTSSMDDVAAAAAGASKSYNSLVHQMGALKEEWRATNDEARRNELGKQIASINQELKDMDASVGNFSRNVGNYESGTAGLVAKFDEWGGIMKQFPPTLGAAKESIGKVGETMQLVGKQPILGIIGLLAPIIVKITEALKENDTAMSAVNRLMASAQPIFDVFAGIVEKVAEGVSFLVEKVLNLVGENGGAFSTLIAKATGVGNAMLQYILTPAKSIISAFTGLGNIIKDVFTGKFDKIKEDAKTAWDGIKEAFSEGFSFEKNFQEGQQIGKDFIAGTKSEENLEESREAGRQAGAAYKEGYAEGIGEGFDEEADEAAALADEEAFNAEMEALAQREKEKTDAIMQGALDRLKAKEDAAQREADLEKAVADETTKYLKEQEEQRKADAEAAAAQRVAVMNASAQAVSGLLNSLADVYESDEKNAEKNEKKIKALRIASATIDMLQGAVTAFASSMSLGPIAGPIVGAVNAAAVVAMGIANINKIKSTNPSSGGGGASASAPKTQSASSVVARAKAEEVKQEKEVSAIVNAPEVETNMGTTRTITSASEEERLNRMASPQKVYILQSDLEASNKSSKVVVEEASF